MDWNLPEGLDNRAAYFDPNVDYWRVPLMRNETVIERPAQQSTITRRYTEEAVRFIRDHQDQSFFLYVPHSMPHTPLFVSDAYRDHSAAGIYGDVIEELDWSVKQIVETIKTAGLEENTLIVFTSDNGTVDPIRDTRRVRRVSCATEKEQHSKEACASPESSGGPTE